MKSLVALVGTKFRGPDMVALLASLPNGEPLMLIREPTNKFDPRAVQVWARGQHLGYVKSNQNAQIATRMDRARADADDDVRFKGKLAIDGGKQPMVEIDE
jgi:hypothetical protein